MIPAIRAELRKLLTVRSTYVILLLCLAITVFFAFYIEGFRQVADVTNPGKLASEVTGAAQALGLLIALVGVLLITHEYRYNTVLYSLTSTSNRLYVLAAKVIVITAFSVLAAIVLSALAPLLTYLGLQAKGLSLSPQDFPIGSLLLHSALFVWGYSMLALIIATIIRNQVGTIAVLFLLPGLGEMLLTLLLRENAKYLPFTTLQNVLQLNIPTYKNALIVLLAYIVAGWVIAGVLYARRDAN